MDITVDTRPLTKIETDALVTYAFELEKPIDSALMALERGHGAGQFRNWLLPAN